MKRRFWFLFACLLWSVVLIGGASAQTFTIQTEGNPGTPCSGTTLPCMSLQTSSSWSQPGDTVLVKAMLHNVPIDLGSLTAELRFDETFYLQPTNSDVLFSDPIQGPTILGGAQSLPVVKTDVPGVLLVNITNPNGPDTTTISDGAGNAFYFHMKLKSPMPDGGAHIWFQEFTPNKTDGNGVLLLSTDEVKLADDPYHSPITVNVRTSGSLSGTVVVDRGLAGNNTDFSGTRIEVWSGPNLVSVTATLSTGTFSISRLLPGYYDLVISRPMASGSMESSFLKLKVREVSIVRGGARTLNEIALAPGNVVDTASSMDSVFLEDLSGLAKAWGTSSGISTAAFVPTWNARADLDQDGQISSNDLYLLAKYWGESGAMSPAPSPGFVRYFDNPAPVATSLTLSLSQSSVQYSDTVTFTATLDPALSGQYLNFLVGGQPVGYALTDQFGSASITAQVLIGEGPQNVTVNFPGYMEYQGAAVSGNLTVAKETALFTFPYSMVADGFNTVGLHVRVTEEQDGSPGHLGAIPLVYFTVKNAAGDVVRTASSPVSPDNHAHASVALGAGSYTLEVAAASNPFFAVPSATAAIQGVPTLTVNPVAVEYSDSATLTATLSPAQADKPIGFRVNQTFVGTGTTNASGVASVPYLANLTYGFHQVDVHFPGDAELLSTAAGGPALHVQKEQATLTYTGDLTVKNYTAISVSATVVPSIDAGTPGNTLGDVSKAEQVQFTVYQDNYFVASAQAAISSLDGTATTSISGLSAGTYTLVVELSPNGFFAAPPVTAQLNAATATLTVTTSGSGKVISSPSGIDCGTNGTQCTASIVEGSVVTLTAQPTATGGSVTWSPNCTVASALSCEVSLNASQTVTAAFSQAPSAQNITVLVTEDTSKNITLSASDPDSASLEFYIDQNPYHGSLSNIVGPSCSTANGVTTCTAMVTYTPYSDYNGPDEFTFTATDPTYLTSAAASVTLTIEAVNDAPVAVDDYQYEVKQGSKLVVPAAGGVLANDYDPDSSAELTAVLVGQPTSGSVVLGTDGAFTYTATTSFYGSAYFEYKSHDGTTYSDTATVSIYVSYNSAPTAEGPSVTPATQPDTAVTINLKGHDADGDSLSLVAWTTSTNGGTVTPVTSTLTCMNDSYGSHCSLDYAYTPPANFSGTDSFEFWVEDGALSSSPLTISVQVGSVTSGNAAPFNTMPAAQTMDEDTALSLTGSSAIQVSDAESTDVQFTLSAQNGTVWLDSINGLNYIGGTNGGTSVTYQGSITAVNAALSTLIFEPPHNFAGSATITISTNDLDANDPRTTENSLSIAIAAINDAPLIYLSLPQITVGQGSSYTFPSYSVTVSDPDASTVSVTLSATAGTIVLGDSSGITITGGADGSGSVSVNGPINSLNSAMSYMTFTPPASFTGSVTFTVTTNDNGLSGTGGALSDTAEFPISVAASTSLTGTMLWVDSVYGAPGQTVTMWATLSTSSETPLEGKTVTFKVGGTAVGTGATDSYGDASVEYTIPSDKPYGYYANEIVAVFAGDETYSQSSSSADMEVLKAVVLTVNDTSGAPGASVDITVSLKEQLTSNPISGASITLFVNGSVTGYPYTDSSGSDTFTYTIPSGPVGTPWEIMAVYYGDSTFLDQVATGTLTIAAATTNAAPLNSVPSQSQYVDEDTSLFFNQANANAIQVSDSEAASLRVTLTAANGTLHLSTVAGLTFASGAQGTASMTFTGLQADINAALSGLEYRPAANFYGSDSLTIVSDDMLEGGGLTDTDSVAIQVNSVNDAPTASGPSSTVDATAGSPVQFTVTMTDMDDDVLTLYYDTTTTAGGSITKIGESCTLNGSGGKTCTVTLEYTPLVSQSGTDSMLAYADDSWDFSDYVTVNFNVTGGGPVGGLEAPTNLSGTYTADASFGYVTLTWTLSSSSTVTGYVIYRDGVEVNTVGFSDSQYVDYLTTAPAGSLTYSVKATDGIHYSFGAETTVTTQ